MTETVLDSAAYSKFFSLTVTVESKLKSSGMLTRPGKSEAEAEARDVA